MAKKQTLNKTRKNQTFERLWVNSKTKSIKAAQNDIGEIGQRYAETIAKKYGARVTSLNQKTEKSIKRKLRTEKREKGIKNVDIKDYSRNTIVCKTPRDVERIVRFFESKQGKQGSVVMRVKRQNDLETGYTGNIINLKNKRGRVFEIQVNTPDMIFLKERERDARAMIGNDEYERMVKKYGNIGGKGHELYEQIRVLPKGDPRREELLRQSREFYSRAPKLINNALAFAVS